MCRFLPLLALPFLLLAAPEARAQAEGLTQIESDLERFVLRQHALGRLPRLDPGALPLNTRAALAMLDSIDASGMSAVDRALLDGYLGRETAGFLGARAESTPLYANRRSFISTSGDGYGLEASPLLDLSYGPAQINRAEEGGTETGSAWTLARGLRVAGHAGHFFAETRIAETQELVPNGSRTRSTAPRIAFARTTGGTANAPDAEYDYVRSTGIVGYRDRFVELRAGRDRNRLGFARGSLILSNYASEYDHAQVRLNVGPLSFQSVYARFLDPREAGGSDSDGVVEQRYGAFHRVAYRPGAGVEIEVFETVIFGDREDDNRNGFELAYLTPFALYRAVERDLGSPDNILLGAGAAWRPTSGVRVYGQGLLDELVAARFFDDAWTSKWGFVLGAQVSDPKIPGLGRLVNTDLQVEYSRIRPYVYAHRDSVTAAVHYGDVLGHPAGPNASDLNVRLEHRPSRDLVFSADLSYTVRGRNTDLLNYGSDPQRENGDRVPEPNPTLQGVRQRLAFADVSFGARVLPDATVGLRVLARMTDDEAFGRSGFVAPQLFLRWSAVPLGPRY
ncbi:capsule assembly Wzi family protein [Rubricoccus marinus]|uniref:Capsule assembly Wzi family protein n=1 Tax=Rubricoccus marinus TaxID=716817 RepID=A0A259U044_9BACT|nr:capsule assembly Wzi family protein [Rubricoccus marinus]OZC03405.1 hypothetical protein BSZ36_10680 [Rubricoccus marinus]